MAGDGTFTNENSNSNHQEHKVRLLSLRIKGWLSVEDTVGDNCQGSVGWCLCWIKSRLSSEDEVRDTSGKYIVGMSMENKVGKLYKVYRHWCLCFQLFLPYCWLLETLPVKTTSPARLCTCFWSCRGPFIKYCYYQTLSFIVIYNLCQKEENEGEKSRQHNCWTSTAALPEGKEQSL